MDKKKTKAGRRKDSKLLWFRVAPDVAKRMDEKLGVLNSGKEVVSGERTKLTRTGLILRAIEGYLASAK